MNNQPTEQHWQVLVLLLKNIAAEKGITREQIAEVTGMKSSSISRIFSLRYRVTLANFIAIARAVGVNFFLEDQDSETDLNQMMESAMEQLDRRPDKLPKN
jgi:transcriptional regulator with XRE-family HTH domain